MLPFSDFKVANLTVQLSELATGRSGAPAKDVYHARVLDFSGGKAVLDIDGRIVIADSELPLKLGGEFDLVVKGYDVGGRAHLQVVGAVETESSAIRPLSDSMISSRLIGFDLIEHAATIESARTLMNMGVPVSKSNMQAMLAALPQNASRQMIQFAAALLKEELPLSRELLQMISVISRDLEELPANMKAVGDAVAQAAAKAQAAQQSAQPDTARPTAEAALLHETLRALAAPQGEDTASIIAKLPDFIKGFMHSTEARLQAMIELNIAQAPGAGARSDFIDAMLTMLKILPETPPADPALIDRAVRSLMQQVNNLEFTGPDSEKFENLRFALNEAHARENPAERFSALQSALADVLRQAIELQSAPPPDPSALSYPSLFDSTLPAMPHYLQELMLQVREMLQQMQQPSLTGTPGGGTLPDAAAGWVKISREQVLSLLTKLAPLLSYRFEGDAGKEINNFLQAAAQWAKQSLKMVGESAEQNPQARSAADTELAAAAARLRTATESPALKEQIQLIARHFSDMPDLRTALSRAAQSPDVPAQAFRGLAMGLQSANLANLVQHTGAAPMNSYVAYFPIQVGDRVEIGKLKVYQRDEDRRDRNKRLKPLNPFDARISIILDTEFLGLTAINLQTYPNKGIKCGIEVRDARRRKIVEKFIGELREALENTAYEQNTVSVSVRRRKPAAGPDDEPPPPNVAAIDLRV